MLLIRLLLIALAIWLVWRLILQPRFRALHAKRDRQPVIHEQQMVRCRHCSLHIPLADALKRDRHYYCSRQCMEHAPDKD